MLLISRNGPPLDNSTSAHKQGKRTLTAYHNPMPNIGDILQAKNDPSKRFKFVGLNDYREDKDHRPIGRYPAFPGIKNGAPVAVRLDSSGHPLDCSDFPIDLDQVEPAHD